MKYHPPPGVVSAYYPADNFAFVHCRPTASKVTVLSPAGTGPGPQWLYTYTFYDKFGRIIQTQTDNHLGGQDIAWNQYNFPGWLLRTRRQHSAIIDNQL